MPLVAEDFVAGLRRLVDPATASQYAQVIDVILNAPDIVAGKKPPDIARHRRAGSRRPSSSRSAARRPIYPGSWRIPPSRRCIVPRSRNSASASRARATRSRTARSSPPNGCRAATSAPVRNPHYWNNAANKLDGVKYLQIADENAELRAYRAGELHCTVVVPRGQFDWIKENLAAELHVAPQLSTYYFGFNLDRPLFAKNPKLRQALSMAIDRERLAAIRVARRRAARLQLGAAGREQLHAAVVRLRVDARRRSVSKTARKLLAEAGYTPREAAEVRAALQRGRSAHQGGGGGRLDVEGSARRRGIARGGGIQIAVRGHRPPRSRHVSAVLGGRLQRRVHLPAVSEGRFRHQSAALFERGVRRAAR